MNGIAQINSITNLNFTSSRKKQRHKLNSQKDRSKMLQMGLECQSCSAKVRISKKCCATINPQTGKCYKDEKLDISGGKQETNTYGYKRITSKDGKLWYCEIHDPLFLKKVWYDGGWMPRRIILDAVQLDRVKDGNRTDLDAALYDVTLHKKTIPAISYKSAIEYVYRKLLTITKN